MQKLIEIAGTVAIKLKNKGETVSVAESSGGGLISAALLSQPGASAYFLGGGVIYTAMARSKLLGLDKKKIGSLRSSTESYSLLLARSMNDILNTTWTVSETGAAGPKGNRYADQPGHTCIGVIGPIERTMTLETASSDRVSNMFAFASTALMFLEQCIDELDCLNHS